MKLGKGCVIAQYKVAFNNILGAYTNYLQALGDSQARLLINPTFLNPR